MLRVEHRTCSLVAPEVASPRLSPLRWTGLDKNSERPHPEQHRGDPPESPLKIKITLNPG